LDYSGYSLLKNSSRIERRKKGFLVIPGGILGWEIGLAQQKNGYSKDWPWVGRKKGLVHGVGEGSKGFKNLI